MYFEVDKLNACLNGTSCGEIHVAVDFCFIWWDLKIRDILLSRRTEVPLDDRIFSYATFFVLVLTIFNF